MKKIITTILILAMVLALYGCAIAEEPPSESATESVIEPATESATELEPEPTESVAEPEPTETIAVPTSSDANESSVTTTDVPTIANPDENYAGSWVSYPDITSGSIYLKIVDSESVWFSMAMTRGPYVRATARYQDGKYVFNEEISPDLEYGVYDGVTYGKVIPKGYLTVENETVVIKFEKGFEISEFNAELKTENILGRGEDAVDEVKNTLESSGWIDIKVEKYDIGEYKFGIGRYSDEHIPTNSILGTVGDLSVGVRVVYDREADDWFAADVFYAHNDGRVLQGDELKAFMLNHGKTDFILPADDVDLLAYFK